MQKTKSTPIRMKEPTQFAFEDNSFSSEDDNDFLKDENSKKDKPTTMEFLEPVAEVPEEQRETRFKRVMSYREPSLLIEEESKLSEQSS